MLNRSKAVLIALASFSNVIMVDSLLRKVRKSVGRPLGGTIHPYNQTRRRT
jgi:hypothetical protein